MNDETTLHVLQLVCPGILGEPSAVSPIYTDLKIAESRGKSTQFSSLVDAGASAENVALAATAWEWAHVSRRPIPKCSERTARDTRRLQDGEEHEQLHGYQDGSRVFKPLRLMPDGSSGLIWQILTKVGKIYSKMSTSCLELCPGARLHPNGIPGDRC